MLLSYSTHGVHMGTRFVKLASELSEDNTTLTVTGPPTPQIYPPGPAYIYVVTAEGVPSFGRKTIVGDGRSPPANEAARIKWVVSQWHFKTESDLGFSSMLENTYSTNITYQQPRVLPTCGKVGGGESITGSFPPTAITGNTRPTASSVSSAAASASITSPPRL